MSGPAGASVRGTFSAAIAGESRGFDTRLGTIAEIEERCGGRPIVEIVNAVVFGRRARDSVALIAAALAAGGLAGEEADILSREATVEEAEGFVVALMGALGFTVGRREAGEASGPLAGPRAGAAGASSPSAP